MSMCLDAFSHNLDLSLDWKFHLGDEPQAWYKGFDDSSWRAVDIPHDWAVEHPFSTDFSSGTGYLPGGIGIYRKSFFLPEECRGKKIFLTFDGIYNNSMVWCNSYYLGKRPSGYNRIIYDITDFACFGNMPNGITVRVNHEEVADSRWYTGSGIYRKVMVSVKERIHIANDGIFILTEEGTKEKAVLSVTTTVNNDTSADSQITVRHTLYDAGRPVACAERERTVASCETIQDIQRLIVNNPRLWSTEEPKLYTCVTELIRSGNVLDREKTITGIRTFFFDPDRGFFLNGRNLKLKGVCVHHDAGCLGAAVREKVWKRRLEALKEMGCNAIRMSHNPHMPELYDLCDEMGFLVIGEAFDEWEGVKNKWVHGHNVYPPAHYGYYEDFPLWHEADLTDMVLRDRNHPSVILWSIGNEIDYPNDPYCHDLFSTVEGNNDKNKPLSERIYDPNRPKAERLVTVAKKLSAIVRRLDTTRPVTAALAFPELSNLTGLADCLDVVGYNYKEHLYEEDHLKYPNHIILGTENTKGLKEWQAVLKHEHISGQFLWTGIDFLGETQGWPSHGSHSGLLDLAGFKKPSYYFRKSLWSEEPVLEIFTSMPSDNVETYLYSIEVRPVWDYIEGQDVSVICFTNCSEAELFINGRSAGRRNMSGNADGFLIWRIPYEEGEIRATAYDNEGNRHDSVLRTTGKPSRIKLSCADEELACDGLDITHIIAEITDDEGNTVWSAEDEINVTVEGGSLLGLENGNLEDTTPYSGAIRKAFNGKLLIYIKAPRTEGRIRVIAAAEGIEPAEIIIPCINR